MSRKDIQKTEPAGSESRRERERRARLELIRNAGARVFARHGFDAATMEMVAAEAELGKATLYYYFETKQQLYGDIVEVAAERLLALAETETAEGAVETAGLEAFARIILTYFRDHSDFAVLLLPVHGAGHAEIGQRLGFETAKKIMNAHRPLLEILEPYARRLDNGGALPHLLGSVLLGFAGKAQHGGGARLEDEVELLCHLLRRACAEE